MKVSGRLFIYQIYSAFSIKHESLECEIPLAELLRIAIRVGKYVCQLLRLNLVATSTTANQDLSWTYRLVFVRLNFQVGYLILSLFVIKLSCKFYVFDYDIAPIASPLPTIVTYL